MPDEFQVPAPENRPPAAAVPPVLATAGSAGEAPPIIAPATRLPHNALAAFLSFFLALFLVDAVVSLLDDALILFAQIHLVSWIRQPLSFFTMVISVVVYVMAGCHGAIPKRWFLPPALFSVVGLIATLLTMAYDYRKMLPVACAVSLVQVLLAFFVIRGLRGGFGFGWPLIRPNQLRTAPFRWARVAGFAALNLFVFLPGLGLFAALCVSLAVGHYSAGFLRLGPGGLTAQVRNYVRDGKTVQLVPMSHIAEARFYRAVSASFPTNSVLLLEGVTDEKNLLTNKVSYARAARALGLAEQHEEFEPTRGKPVMADVDVEQFSTRTLGALNVVMLIHAKGLTPETLPLLAASSQWSETDLQLLLDDLLVARNAHVLRKVDEHLPKSDFLVIPWGAAHMPGIERELRTKGFRLEGKQDYSVVRFSKHR
jgi:hypothetical protein